MKVGNDVPEFAKHSDTWRTTTFRLFGLVYTVFCPVQDQLLLSRMRKNRSDNNRPAMHKTAFLCYFADNYLVHVLKIVFVGMHR